MTDGQCMECGEPLGTICGFVLEADEFEACHNCDDDPDDCLRVTVCMACGQIKT